MTTLITSLDDLRTRSSAEGGCECFIALNSFVRSSKQIWYDEETELWSVHNDIDDSDLEDMSIYELESETHIIEALKKNALFAY